MRGIVIGGAVLVAVAVAVVVGFVLAALVPRGEPGPAVAVVVTTVTITRSNDFFVPKSKRDDPQLVTEILGLMIGLNEDETLERATPGQRKLYVLSAVEGEINNGGFEQLFWNSAGEWAEEAIRYADELGAAREAELLRRAAAMFPNGVPSDRGARQAQITESDRAKLGAIDAAWFDELLGFEPSLRRYIKAHPNEFFRGA